MPTTLSNEEVFGGAGLAHDSVFPPEDKTATLDSPWENVRSVLGTAAKRLGMATAAGADMFLGIPGQAIGIGADIGGRAAALGSGESRKMQEETGAAAKEHIPAQIEHFLRMAPGGLTQPVQTIIKTLSGEKEFDQSGVTKAIDSVASGIDKVTRGYVSAADAKSLLDTAMLYGGAKGGDLALEAAMKSKVKTGAEARASYAPDEIPHDEVFGPKLDSIPEPVTVTPKILKQIFADAKNPKNAVDSLFAAAAKDGKQIYEARNTPSETPNEAPVGSPEWLSARGMWEHNGKTYQRGADGRTEQVHFGGEYVPGLSELLEKEPAARTPAEKERLEAWRAAGMKERGFSDPAHLTTIAALTGLGVAGVYYMRDQHPEVLKEFQRRVRKMLGMEPLVEDQQKEIDEAWRKHNEESVPLGNDEGNGLAGATEKLIPLAAMAGAIKAKGGMWHPEAVERLATPLTKPWERQIGLNADEASIVLEQQRRGRPDAEQRLQQLEEDTKKQMEAQSRLHKMVGSYLNKHAGTEGDPLAGYIEVPVLKAERKTSENKIKEATQLKPPTLERKLDETGSMEPIDKSQMRLRTKRERFQERQEEAAQLAERIKQIDAALEKQKDGVAHDAASEVEVPFGEGVKKWGELMSNSIGKATGPLEDSGGIWKRFEGDTRKGDEPLYNLDDFTGGEEHRGSFPAIKSHLSHVGDFLRQNVDPAKLGQYDLVRAVKETAANDARVAKEMEKASGESTKQLPVYKDYGDGFKWVELKLPEKLTEEQAKGVRRTKDTDQFEAERFETMDEAKPGEVWAAIDKNNKVITNSYTQEGAVGRTPEEAYLAGRLAEEGNQLGHCVGGYCDAVASGESKIFSLRDAKGKSHVTIEIQPGQLKAENLEPTFGNVSRFMEERGLSVENWNEGVKAFMKEYQGKPQLEDILQIKGKQNRAPAPAYLPYVQDFVRSGKWGEVGDLANAGLVDTSKFKLPDGQQPKERFVSGPSQEVLDTLQQHAIAQHLGDIARRNGPERGFIDPKLMIRLAAVATGAAIGGYVSDNKLLGAVIGGIGAGAATKLNAKGAAAAVRSAFAADSRLRINQFADAHDAGMARAARAIWQQASKIVELAPDAADRVALTHAIQGGKRVEPRLAPAAQKVKDFFGAMGQAGQDAGVLKALIDNYVTNLWDLTGKNKSKWEEILTKAGGPSMSPESRFALKRKIENLEEGKRLGLVPQTEDVAQIMSIYGNSLARSIENKKMLTALKDVKDPSTGTKLLLPSTKAPHSYVVIDHPQMNGLRVHPDIAPSMKFIFDNSDPGVVARGLEGLNTAIKRSAVSFSLFHAKALIDAQIGAHGMLRGVPRAAKALGQAALPQLFGENTFLKQLREGGAGDLIDKAQTGGLKISMEKGKLADEDVNGSFYTALKSVQQGLDSIIPGMGLPVKAISKVNHLVDVFMWERLHAGMKLGTFAEKLEVLRNSDAKAAVREGRPPKAEVDLVAQAASFTNDIYGGLNWRRLAEEARTKWGRDIALSAYSPKGRRVMQLLVFAPDWTLSTTRALTRTFGRLAGYEKGSGPRGIFEPQNATDLHRQYLLRSAAYYALVGDSINYALSGHHLWDKEQKDWTTIDMGDGRTMQWSKHSMEPVHWVTKPGQQALNKLAFFPKEAANQMLGSEYLSASGHAPRMDISPAGRAMHVVKSLTPIAGQQAFGEKSSQGGAVAGFLGAPIYGKTFEERQMEKVQRRQNAIRRRIEKRQGEAR